MKILYCVTGMWHCGVIEGEILKRDQLWITAKRTFSLEPDQSKIVASRGGQVQVGLSIIVYNNVIMNCNFISDLSEQSMFYREIVKFIEKEASREN